MKNIHVLPTEKSGRLHEFGDIWFSHKEPTECFRNYNIYITSDEKFVRDEYVTDGIEVIKASPKLVNAQSLIDRRDWKKIILTTDQDLIKDDVQAIDDEFLEWFVKNPSCERVEVEKGCILYDFKYKIIIPKEETKQEKLEEFIKNNTMRERILKQFEPIIGIIPDESEQFFMCCDIFDYVSVLMNCEQEFNCSIPDGDLKDEYDFDTVKDFVDWVITCVSKAN